MAQTGRRASRHSAVRKAPLECYGVDIVLIFIRHGPPACNRRRERRRGNTWTAFDVGVIGFGAACASHTAGTAMAPIGWDHPAGPGLGQAGCRWTRPLAGHGPPPGGAGLRVMARKKYKN